jgi:hypothetical protein
MPKGPSRRRIESAEAHKTTQIWGVVYRGNQGYRLKPAFDTAHALMRRHHLTAADLRRPACAGATAKAHAGIVFDTRG